MVKIIIFVLVFILASCSDEKAPATFAVDNSPKQISTQKTDEINEFNKEYEGNYKIGPTDILFISTYPYKENSGEYRVGQDGYIILNVGGSIKVSGLTREACTSKVRSSLLKYYEDVKVEVGIKQYNNLSVYVLGMVSKPGQISLKHNNTLLAVLSKAGAMSSTDSEIKYSECSIVRGNKKILWLDLKSLLKEGQTLLNVKLNNNDIVFLPSPEKIHVFVMGEVAKPGAFSISSKLHLLDALNLAGGVTENAVSEIKLIRKNSENKVVTFDMDDLIDNADFSRNFKLRKNDVIYVPRKGAATFNYYLRMVNPFSQMLIFGTSQ